MYKNQLQEICQKKKIGFPKYSHRTVKGGWKSIVEIEKKKIESGIFGKKVESDQDAARLMIELLTNELEIKKKEVLQSEFKKLVVIDVESIQKSEVDNEESYYLAFLTSHHGLVSKMKDWDRISRVSHIKSQHSLLLIDGMEKDLVDHFITFSLIEIAQFATSKGLSEIEFRSNDHVKMCWIKLISRVFFGKINS